MVRDRARAIVGQAHDGSRVLDGAIRRAQDTYGVELVRWPKAKASKPP